MSIKKNLGNKIREIRINKGLTQEALAEKIDMSSKSLSQIELGNNFVSAETLEELCSALNITPDVLFNSKPHVNDEKNCMNEIIRRLKNNSTLLKTIYKIVLALDY